MTDSGRVVPGGRERRRPENTLMVKTPETDLFVGEVVVVDDVDEEVIVEEFILDGIGVVDLERGGEWESL